MSKSSHAILAPSSAKQWLHCIGSPFMEKGLPDQESEYAKEGTAAHEYASIWLTTGVPPQLPWAASNGVRFKNDKSEAARMGAIADYVYKIKELAQGQELLIEQRLPIGHITLEEGAEGTGDSVMLSSDGKTLAIDDLKFGMGVKIYAKNNYQMMLYALGALHQFGVLGDFEKVVMRIHQPRLDHFDEWECSVTELLIFAAGVKFLAKEIWDIYNGVIPLDPEKHLSPSEDTCRFCKAKSTCSKAITHALTIAAGDFVDLSETPTAKLEKSLHNIEHLTNAQLSWVMQNIGLLEDIIKAVRARIEAELFAGHEIPGFKLVAGKRGNRKWADEDEVEKQFRDWRMKQDAMYNMKIISPADAEKAFKGQPKRWKKLQEFITQNEGQPSVAPSTDPRPVLMIGAREDDFDVIKDEIIS